MYSGLRISRPMSNTFLPNIAVIAARFVEMKVLPSELIVDEIAITGVFSSSSEELKLCSY